MQKQLPQEKQASCEWAAAVEPSQAASRRCPLSHEPGREEEREAGDPETLGSSSLFLENYSR